MRNWIQMNETSGTRSSGVRSKQATDTEVVPVADDLETQTSSLESADSTQALQPSNALDERASQPQYRVYKRRWFGLTQLVLLNIVVSWDWLTFSASSTTCSQYFRVSESAVNWLSTGFLFAFVIISPVVLWALHHGPKPSVIASAALILIGNWIRYGGARSNKFGVLMFGQIIIGFAQPFVLAAPTRYSDLWFTDRGRISATAVASLANPLGGALGQLVGPFWAVEPSDVPNMVLYVAILSTIASIPSFFIPAKPPTPPSASHEHERPQIMESIRGLAHNRSFWLLFIPFSIYVGYFNALSSLINQVLGPYGISEDDAGIAGAILIVVGLVSSAITSPIIDRTKQYLLMIKICCPLIGLSYLVFYWAPPTGGLVAPYVILAVLGAASFSLVPIALEYLVEVTWPVSPEVSSVISWTGGQFLGGIFIVIMDALRDGKGSNGPKNNLQRSLIFEAVIAMLTIIPPMLIGMKSLGFGVQGAGRLRMEQRQVIPHT